MLDISWFGPLLTWIHLETRLCCDAVLSWSNSCIYTIVCLLYYYIAISYKQNIWRERFLCWTTFHKCSHKDAHCSWLNTWIYTASYRLYSMLITQAARAWEVGEVLYFPLEYFYITDGTMFDMAKQRFTLKSLMIFMER